MVTDSTARVRTHLTDLVAVPVFPELLILPDLLPWESHLGVQQDPLALAKGYGGGGGASGCWRDVLVGLVPGYVECVVGCGGWKSSTVSGTLRHSIQSC